MELNRHLSLMVQAAIQGGNQALARRGRSPIVIDTGGPGLTTAEDEAVQATVFRLLREGNPGVNIVGEEAPDKRMTDEAYIVDPIDGSVNYSKDGLEWACTIAYKREGRIDAGVIWQPRLNTLISAARGGELRVEVFGAGAEPVREPIPTVESSLTDLRKAVVIAQTLQDYFYSDHIIHEVFGPLLRAVRYLMMSGSNCDGIKRLVLGHVDAFVGWGNIWDFAAGQLFVEMAGGAVSDYDGNPVNLNLIAPQRVIFARNDTLLNTLLPITKAWPLKKA